MSKIIGIQEIDKTAWDALVEDSPLATWFQTREAYDFFESLSFLDAFCMAIVRGERLKGVVVGYVQKEGGRLQQFLSRRAVVFGGPLLAEDIVEEDLVELLTALKKGMKKKAIYIETRNFNNYTKWRGVFERCGYGYNPHLNFQIKCTNLEEVDSRIGKHRRRYIRLSIKNGARVVDNPTMEQIHSFYSILLELYKTKVKSPLFPMVFFEELYKLSSCRFVLIEYNGSIVGGSVCVLLTNKAVYEWFACGKDGVYKNIYPSSLVKYAGICYALDNGFKVFEIMELEISKQNLADNWWNMGDIFMYVILCCILLVQWVLRC